jgi:hypothetical protein
MIFFTAESANNIKVSIDNLEPKNFVNGYTIFFITVERPYSRFTIIGMQAGFPWWESIISERPR